MNSDLTTVSAGGGLLALYRGSSTSQTRGGIKHVTALNSRFNGLGNSCRLSRNFRGSMDLFSGFEPQGAIRVLRRSRLREERERASRRLPLSAATGTFAPFLQHYIDVAKLLITVAAASIAFGGGQATRNETTIAKLILAFSILYGLLFCASMLYMYDEYGQNIEVYTRFWYSTVESLGVSALLCFILGYGVWAFSLV